MQDIPHMVERKSMPFPRLMGKEGVEGFSLLSTEQPDIQSSGFELCLGASEFFKTSKACATSLSVLF